MVNYLLYDALLMVICLVLYFVITFALGPNFEPYQDLLGTATFIIASIIVTQISQNKRREQHRPFRKVMR
jgi:nicotinamide riboside transporter PnuC